jgi:hypothetical protein
MFKLLSTGNPKTLKGEKQGYMTYIMHLAPVDLAGYGNVCPKATDGCKAACLNLAGRGGMFKKGEITNMIQQARIRKTRMFFEDRAAFLSALVTDITKAIKQAKKKDFIPVFRLNGTSDLSWEKYEIANGLNIFQMFPDVQFYDYTKVLGRKCKDIKNYHLTFSKADGNDADAGKAMQQGYNVAAVFDSVPAFYNGVKVIDGDESDLRFLDEPNTIVGLTAKGKAKKDYSGFVIRLKTEVNI